MKKISSIRSQIRNAILLLAGCLIILLMSYLSKSLLGARESDALESLSMMSERDATNVDNHLKAVDRAVNALVTTLNGVQSETYPGLETVSQLLKLTPEIKRIWIYKKSNSSQNWIPWVNIQAEGVHLEKTKIPKEKWSIDTNQVQPILTLFLDSIHSKSDLNFRVLISIDAQDFIASGKNLGYFSLLSDGIEPESLLGKTPNQQLLERIKNSKQLSDSFRFSENGKNYLAFIHKAHQELWLVRWVDLSLVNSEIFITLLELLSILLLFFGVLLYSAEFFSKRLSKPFRDLMKGTEEIGNGNFNLKLSVNENEESSKLADSLSKMAQEIKQLIVVEQQKSRLESEMKAASMIQNNMIPQGPVVLGEYWIQSVYRPALECSGDWWQYYSFGSKLLLVMADVTGHGVGSALTTSALQACYRCFISRNQSLNGEPELVLKEFIGELNTGVYSVGLGEQNATCLALLCDRNADTVTYINCGHPSGILIDRLTSEMVLLKSSGEILGSSKEFNNQDSSIETIKVNQNSFFFLYTDGLLDLDLAATPGAKRKVVKQKSIEWSQADHQHVGLTAQGYIFDLIGDRIPDDDVSLVMMGLSNVKGGNA